MPARFYAAQDGHLVQLVAPVNITGGVTSPAFSLKNYAHASIVVGIGVSAAAPTTLLLNACTNAAGAGATPIPFNLFTAETANLDVLSAKVPVTAAGYSPSGNDGIFYVIEIDAQTLPQGFPYLQVQIVNGANSVIAAVYAVLSGARFACDQSPTVLV